MTHVLIVDDEPLILQGLRAQFRREPRLTVSVADSVSAALDVLERRPVDILLTDIRMPGEDGATLLAVVRKRWPRVIRMAMSGHMDRNAWFRVAPLAQAVLDKPCRWATVRTHLLRAAAVQTRFQDDRLIDALSKLGGLPVAPTIYLRLTEMMADPRVGIGAVVTCVQTDPGVAAMVLRLANGAWLGLPRRVVDLHEALRFLGIDMVRNLVLSAELLSGMSARASRAGVNSSAVQRRATHTSRIAAQLVQPENASVAATAGLLHEVGTLALAVAQPDGWRDVQARTRDNNETPEDAQRAVFGCTQAIAGAVLLNRWGLPLQLVDAIAFQDQPRANDGPLDVAGAVYVAQRMAHSDDGRGRVRGLDLDQDWIAEGSHGVSVAGWRRIAEAVLANAG